MTRNRKAELIGRYFCRMLPSPWGRLIRPQVLRALFRFRFTHESWYIVIIVRKYLTTVLELLHCIVLSTGSSRVLLCRLRCTLLMDVRPSFAVDGGCAGTLPRVYRERIARQWFNCVKSFKL
jgi:hypothetical protein